MEKKETASEAAAATNGRLVIADLGKQSRKKVKKLRKGEGPLTEKVNGIVEGMKAEGAVGKDADVVVVIVQRKQPKAGRFGGFRMG